MTREGDSKRMGWKIFGFFLIVGAVGLLVKVIVDFAATSVFTSGDLIRLCNTVILTLAGWYVLGKKVYYIRTPPIMMIVVGVLVIGLTLAFWDYKKHGARQQRFDISKTQADKLKDTRLSGDEQLYKQNYETAIQEYERALKLSPRDAYLHNDLGAAYYHLGLQSMEPPVTEDEFEFGIEVDARYEGSEPLEMVKNNLEKIKSGVLTVVVNDQAKRKEIETYVRSLDHYIHVEEEIQDGDREFWLTIVKGKTKEAFLNAEKEYLEAIEIKAVKDRTGRKYSNYSTASRNLGTLYFRMGRKKEAIAQWRRALQIEPTDAELRNLLGEYE